MVLDKRDLDALIMILKNHCPVDTGNLRDNGIQGFQNIGPGLYTIQIGNAESKQGAQATDTYALFTEIRNKTSIGWVERALKSWIDFNKYKWVVRLEGSVDQDVI